VKAAEISLSALDVEWRRIEIIAQNLANANTTRTADGSVYRPRHLISGPAGDFRAMLDATHAAEPTAASGLRGVAVYGIEFQNRPSRYVYDPDSAEADARGMVSLPNVDEAREMTSLIKTERAYEANLAALNIARQMYAKALELGKA